jgi:asparagine synthase (glutamine-hydrolysing)
LYPDLVEFALSLPASYLVSKKGESKHLFREAMKGIVPEDILKRTDKIGAKTPDRQILKSLSSRESFISRISDSKLVKGVDLLAEDRTGISEDVHYIQMYWRIFNLFEWMSAHKINEY